MVVASCFVTGCMKEDDDFFSESSLHETYLSIEDFSSKTTFSDAEQEIIRVAMNRIGKFSQIKDGHVTITKTAQELNIAEDIYEMFEIFASYFNNQQPEVSLNPVKLKAGTEQILLPPINTNPCDWVSGIIIDYFKINADNTAAGKSGSEFSIECFKRYWSGTGKGMELSEERFKKIKEYIPKRSKNDPDDVSKYVYTKNNKTYYKYIVSFYGTPYALSLGSATVVYDESFKPVGLYDTYDFNWGGRSWNTEAMTRAVSIAGTVCMAKAFGIYYGTY
jgi:hypothetical protein